VPTLLERVGLPAEVAQRPGHGIIDRRFVGGVAGQAEDGVARGRVEVEAGDAGALGEEAVGDAEADAGGGACDEDAAALVAGGVGHERGSGVGR
jgi:hypothetical protein